MNSKRKIEINIVEVQTYKILIQINSINKYKANQRTLNKDFILYICQENEMTTELFVIKFLK